MIIIALAALAVAGYLTFRGPADKPAAVEVAAAATPAASVESPAPSASGPGLRPGEGSAPARVTREPKPQDPPEEAVIIPVADLTEGTSKFFEYTTSNSTRMRFFVVKSSDGIYRAALDACDVCYQAKQGYFQDGADMTCKKCNRRFPISRVNEESGGCNPVPLERKLVGSNLLILKGDLEKRASYF